MMPFFSESAFTIVNFVAERLKYVGWIPMVAAFLTLSLSLDKERQFTRIAKISRFVHPGVVVFYISYFILHPKAGYLSLIRSSYFVRPLFLAFMNPIFWLVIGDHAISLNVKAYCSHRQAIEENIKSKVLRHICLRGLDFGEASGPFGTGLLLAVSLVFPVADKGLDEGFGIYSAIAASFVDLVILGLIIYMNYTITQKRIAKEFSAEGGMGENKAEFADEKVPAQAHKQV
ncbi:hypothetical protein DL89DRAFT_270014 [Linderina pennispora]|uniref:Uncharacterized protein n=1 Tax=Linderina pennispora TaxID=61395 RepID=A0A1Y1VZM3_9FUNG|nr:uncharacterized protein DL89DRAFT_270014 [Linderina pennispora]ORX66475.1 hypothetical protein DL89DRAFT_270014 [Linderina pennispora]